MSSVENEGDEMKDSPLKEGSGAYSEELSINTEANTPDFQGRYIRSSSLEDLQKLSVSSLD